MFGWCGASGMVWYMVCNGLFMCLKVSLVVGVIMSVSEVASVRKCLLVCLRAPLPAGD